MPLKGKGPARKAGRSKGSKSAVRGAAAGARRTTNAGRPAPKSARGASRSIRQAGEARSRRGTAKASRRTATNAGRSATSAARTASRRTAAGAARAASRRIAPGAARAASRRTAAGAARAASRRTAPGAARAGSRQTRRPAAPAARRPAATRTEAFPRPDAKKLYTSFLEIVRRTSADLPRDVLAAIEAGRAREADGSNARWAMEVIGENITMAREKSAPLCQDTGTIIFYINAPRGYDEKQLRTAAEQAVAEATRVGYLRQNSVDSLSGRNTGNNLGAGSPVFHFHQWDGPGMQVRLILKGGGCENVGVQYSLPDGRLGADRDLAGVEKCILDAAFQAQGKGCGPGVLGVCVGGDRATGYVQSKEQLLRPLDDTHPEPALAALESSVVDKANRLGIGPMGFGGATTLLGCKIGALNRLPASFFVSISYMCWAFRRQGADLRPDGTIAGWLY